MSTNKILNSLINFCLLPVTTMHAWLVSYVPGHFKSCVAQSIAKWVDGITSVEFVGTTRL